MKKRGPGIAAGRVVGIGGSVQTLAIGLGQARLFRGRRPICPSSCKPEICRLGAEVWDAARDSQKPDQARQASRDLERLPSAAAISAQPLGDHFRLRLDRRRPAHEGREICRRLPEGRQMTVNRGDGRGREGAAAAQILDDLMDERHGLARAMQHHFGEDAALVAGQALAQPASTISRKMRSA